MYKLNDICNLGGRLNVLKVVIPSFSVSFEPSFHYTHGHVHGPFIYLFISGFVAVAKKKLFLKRFKNVGLNMNQFGRITCILYIEDK